MGEMGEPQSNQQEANTQCTHASIHTNSQTTLCLGLGPLCFLQELIMYHTRSFLRCLHCVT